MTDYRQYPDPEPRGRHARARVQREAGNRRPANPEDRRAAAGSGARRAPASQQPGQGQPAPQYQAPRQQAPRQQAPRPAQPYAQPTQQQAAYRPQPQPYQQAYRPVQPQAGQQAYRPAPASYGYGGMGPSGPNGPGANGRKKKGGPWRVVFWIALVVFVVSLAALGAIGFSYWQGQQTYNEVAQDGFKPPADVEGTSLADFKVDWDALKAINPDTVGWIYVPGTNINYPIVHTTDNEKYLTHDFKGSEGWIATFGAIFLAAENAGDFSDANNIVYGHHLNDGSMFASIAGMDDPAAFNASRTAYILTPQGNLKLTTFSLVHCAADDPLAQTAFASEEERTAYVQDKIGRSVVSVSDLPAAADMKQTFAFATCDNLPSDGRWVLFSYVAESTIGPAPADAAEGGLADPNAAEAVGDASKEIAS